MVSSVRVSILLTVVLFIYSTALLAKVSLERLEGEIGLRLDRVEQFKVIKELAHEYGIEHAYLFGGTASAWAHYVYQDLEREDGDPRYPKSRFNYDYTEIFRANQDMDILIDGSVEQAEKLEKALQEKFQFFQGNKSVFEVRLRDIARGDKDALTDPNFFNQNTDSHSTGLITLVGDGEEVVQDTHNAKVHTPQFLKDVYERQLHFYFDHRKHITTKRYKEGKNPELFAVIRNLIKMFQFELEADAESWKAMKMIINDFDPQTAKSANSYVSYWLEKNGPKLFQNAVNMEFAWNTLEKIGLRQKLIEASDLSNAKSLAWWMSKEPLRSFEVGRGRGKTAEELGISIVAHETSDFAAYESITKSKRGRPNVFISRVHNPCQENAAHGEGFYTAKGLQGAKNTGVTIRFNVNPKAREGKDFIFTGKPHNFVIFKNVNAFTVINESLSLSAPEYFNKLDRGEFLFDFSDKGVKNNVMRRISVNISMLTKNEKEGLRKLIMTSKREIVVSEAFTYLPELFEGSPVFLKSLFERGHHQFLRDNFKLFLGSIFSNYQIKRNGFDWKSLLELSLYQIEGSAFITLHSFIQKNLYDDFISQEKIIFPELHSLSTEAKLVFITNKKLLEKLPYKKEQLLSQFFSDFSKFTSKRLELSIIERIFITYFQEEESLYLKDVLLENRDKLGSFRTKLLAKLTTLDHWNQDPEFFFKMVQGLDLTGHDSYEVFEYLLKREKDQYDREVFKQLISQNHFNERIYEKYPRLKPYVLDFIKTEEFKKAPYKYSVLLSLSYVALLKNKILKGVVPKTKEEFDGVISLYQNPNFLYGFKERRKLLDHLFETVTDKEGKEALARLIYPHGKPNPSLLDIFPEDDLLRWAGLVIKNADTHWGFTEEPVLRIVQHFVKYEDLKFRKLTPFSKGISLYERWRSFGWLLYHGSYRKDNVKSDEQMLIAAQNEILNQRISLMLKSGPTKTGEVLFAQIYQLLTKGPEKRTLKLLETLDLSKLSKKESELFLAILELDEKGLLHKHLPRIAKRSCMTLMEKFL